MYVRDDTVALRRSRGLFLPLACDVHPAVSHRVLYQRRLEKTHSTGNDGTLSYSPQPTPPLSGTEDRSAYRYALATLLRWKASAPALGIHAFSSPRLTSKDFFAPGFSGWLPTFASTVLLLMADRRGFE